ncbi:uncharacterized protein PODANS_4_4800 [Podospora anserina S mat+]|uniref:Podospora anserina S mat+ genomic DNA chromosome 4, supercontig 4 n=1 Tax=Podospora anserina (strain S / ATCC MYA-4624 / DSM 980 / FGSC 10383) TaxID=515849 RepID=B2AQA7_PODAN|nr:uncharacterized protein PODANS_4_4800 [Podospora anserina S mat+]CAP67046.1 unnamed protein product [Podospora anserina S mat+]CDP28789.1 Putative protein of unknown function [Podospora anserina S mat+]
MAFFADVGGFVFEAAASGPFPLNAKQLHWLVVNNHIEDPETDVGEIWYKSKQDRFARLITSFQVGYTIIHAIGRAGQLLAITTLELNTMDIVVCSLMTAYAWLHKPADVRTPIKLATRTAIGDITGDRPWRTTPLDFIDENGPGRTLNVQPLMKMPVIPPDQLIQHIPNDRFPMNPYGAQEYFLCFAKLLFTAVHVAGWNFSFPTTTEKVLWRVSSSIPFGVTAAFWVLETAASWIRLGRWKWTYLWITNKGRYSRF